MTGTERGEVTMIDHLRLVRATGYPKQPELSDDEVKRYPYSLIGNFSPPELMQVAFIMLHGGSEIINIRGDSVDVLMEWAALNKLPEHPRLRWLQISGRDGSILHSVNSERHWVDGPDRVY